MALLSLIKVNDSMIEINYLDQTGRCGSEPDYAILFKVIVLTVDSER